MSLKFTAISSVIQAVIVFTLVTQSDVTVAPLVKYILGAVAVALTAYAANAKSDPA